MFDEVQRRLTSDLAAQTARYESARDVAARITDRLSRREDITADMARLAELMRQAADSAKQADALREKWDQLGRPNSPPLRAAFEAHTDVLRDLIEIVQRAEQSAVAARDGLQPQLDSVARDRKAVQVYGQAARL